jgi:small subunit ribosomal protein S5
MLGITDIIGKSYGSSNANVVIRNMFKMFSSIYPPRYVANKRGQKLITTNNH